MNGVIRKLLAGFYRACQKAYEEYKVEGYKKYPNILIGENVVISPETRMPYMKGNIEIGDRTWMYGSITTFPHNKDCKVKIGEDCYIGEYTRIWCSKGISIGDRVLIAHNVNIFDNTTHPIDKKIRYQHELIVKTTGMPDTKFETLGESKVKIEDDVWISCNCVIQKGVTIGEGSIVSAGSVVVKDVPSNTMVAGNPACVIKYLNYEDSNEN